MFKKEAWDALKREMECLAILGAIPLAYLLDRFLMKFRWEFHEIFQVVFITTIVIFAIYAGATIFQTEKKDRAFEYLFSLPLSRIKIIFLKLLPRIIILLLLTLILGLFFNLNIFSYGIIFFVLFFVSAFLSINVNSVIINLTGVLILYVIFDFLWLILRNFSFFHGLESSGTWINPTFQLLAAVLILLPIGTAFWLTFKKMDVKSMKYQMRTYYAIVFPTIIILIVFISLMYKNYILNTLN